jgi:hypothetical protein
MLYWLFTDGRDLLTGLAAPLLCLSLILPLVVSAISGAGIQRSREAQSVTGWKRRLKLLTHAIVLLGATTLYLWVAGDMAIQPARGRQATSTVIPAIVGGPDNIQHMRLLMAGLMLACVWLVVTVVLQSGIRSGGWLRERVDRLRRPQIKRGALGSSHFCTPREYRRFRRSDPEGLTLLGAFWGDERRRTLLFER